jgi:hypothetical protein
MQVSIVVAAVLAAAWVVASNVDDWADWVVLGVIILAVVGFALAIHQRRYPTKKRTFIRDRGRRSGQRSLMVAMIIEATRQTTRIA